MTPTAISGTTAIRVGIAALALFAFALSYDALQQMAVAIHIRGPLTYAFPLVIDGFIAIGVGALLMLRTAPTSSRAYVWTLVGAATATSLWANALHAIRLNQQTHQGDSLRLDNLPVGVLSAIAPLALAGAVHLYIVIRRHTTSGRSPSALDRAAAPADGTGHVPQPAPAHVAHAPVEVARNTGEVAPDATEAADDPHPSAEPQGHAPDAFGETSRERLALARTAPLGRNGRASRRHIEETLRSNGLSIGRKEADTLKNTLQAELDTVHTPQEPTDAAPIGTT
ncbi:DUF2637 domain-containing protein [Streptomyces sp. AA1529]|uniref:DUF2637 domain-containing protein n=1 Tax=Streptomyces sp. AA1529 TaxID=1203257 RepID=UPI003D72733B